MCCTAHLATSAWKAESQNWQPACTLSCRFLRRVVEARRDGWRRRRCSVAWAHPKRSACLCSLPPSLEHLCWTTSRHRRAEQRPSSLSHHPKLHLALQAAMPGQPGIQDLLELCWAPLELCERWGSNEQGQAGSASHSNAQGSMIELCSTRRTSGRQAALPLPPPAARSRLPPLLASTHPPPPSHCFQAPYHPSRLPLLASAAQQLAAADGCCASAVH